MKKTRNLLLAGLLLFGVASCGDSKNSSSSGGLLLENKTILTVDNVTTVIGQTSTKTITITNPFNEEATMDIYGVTFGTINYPVIITDTTCGTLSNGMLNATGIKMQANQSCEITLTHAPTTLETIQYSFTAEFRQLESVICPTPTTVPTLEQVLNSQVFLDYEINYYAQNSNNVKSPAYINIHYGKISMNENFELTGDVPAKPFTIELTEGDTYTISYNMSSWTFTADNINCSIEGSTITALKTGSCTLNVGYTYKAGENNNISPTTYLITPDGDKTLKPTYSISLDYYDYGYGTPISVEEINQMLQQYCQQNQGQQKAKYLDTYFK